jgi:hypothetical protein
LYGYALEIKGHKRNFEFKSFDFNFNSLGAVLGQAQPVWLST